MSFRSAEDAGLVSSFLEGDRRAFDELMRAHEDRVFAICLRVLSDREAALDAVQETFITVYRKAQQFSGASAFSTWLYRIAVNTCFDQLRRTRRHQAQPLPDTTEPADERSQDALESVELRPDLERALEDLPPEFRAAIVLSDLEGLPLQAVAEALDVPIGTVKSRVFRGRRLLAEHLRNLSGSSAHQRGEHDA
ncbi:MAG: sigma-70 family RNA polymerase sigma factor [Acidimicrobiia bacterium]|nr:sigma-70 family RNA polymerase sigma factor [Acidimicrobiia bacterium]MDH3396303.1 sigma-70 family RNA polymerase sigma factor [Acidimicrobiia bacterium]MDH5616853.1 sigma-70 family RNA polymerase sigma factor [Acidimicrobiia bacterium]